MKIIKMSEATEPLAENAQELNKEPLVLTVDDKPVAAFGIYRKRRPGNDNPERQSSISRLNRAVA